MKLGMVILAGDRLLVQLDGESDADLRLVTTALSAAARRRSLNIIEAHVHRLSGAPIIAGAVLDATEKEEAKAKRVLEEAGVRVVSVSTRGWRTERGSGSTAGVSDLPS